MTKKYANKTKVPVSRSQAEIEKELSAFGATGFCCGWQGNVATVMFVVNDRSYKYQVFVHEESAENRRLWRCVLAAIKGKLISVNENITTFEEEFLSALILPTGETVGEKLLPEIEQHRLEGHMPEKLLT
jgi:hypothetical protein